jgi:hypothetical protein
VVTSNCASLLFLYLFGRCLKQEEFVDWFLRRDIRIRLISGFNDSKLSYNLDMKRQRIISVLAFLLVFVLACQTITLNVPWKTTSIADESVLEATTTLVPTPLPTLRRLEGEGYRVHIHPDGELFVGDLISFEVIPLHQTGSTAKSVEVIVDEPEGPHFGPIDMAPFGLRGQVQATFPWAWDTSGWQPGEVDLLFRILPEGTVWRHTVILHSQEELPENEADARWEVAEGDCCTIYYISGTAAARDIDEILMIAEEQADSVEWKFGLVLEEPLSIVLVPRVLVHGGMVSDEIYLSYLDRNYAGNMLDTVLHHEIVHALDRRQGADLRPLIFAEGVAVYLSGGHFKSEELLERAAILLELDWYIPLTKLANDFYSFHHETSYLQAAALVEFMVQTWGWQTFLDFYTDIHEHSSGTNAGAIDYALRQHFEFGIHELEELYLDALHRQTITSANRSDVEQTVAFYDTLRRYQLNLDPTAYVNSVWWPDVDDLRSRDITADYLRHPQYSENITVETMLISANRYLVNGEVDKCAMLLEVVNDVLALIEEGQDAPFEVSTLSSTYYDITIIMMATGYIPQTIQLNDNSARVEVYSSQAELVEINLVFQGEAWEMQ